MANIFSRKSNVALDTAGWSEEEEEEAVSVLQQSRRLVTPKNCPQAFHDFFLLDNTLDFVNLAMRMMSYRQDLSHHAVNFTCIYVEYY